MNWTKLIPIAEFAFEAVVDIGLTEIADTFLEQLYYQVPIHPVKKICVKIAKSVTVSCVANVVTTHTINNIKEVLQKNGNATADPYTSRANSKDPSVSPTKSAKPTKRRHPGE